MRKLGLDIGDVRIGIAQSDMLGIIAGGYTSYTRKDIDSDINYILEYSKQNNVDTIVIGLPLMLDGNEGQSAEKCRSFGEKLREKTDIKLEFIDERLSTVQAERMLIEGGVRREKRKTVIDKVAATIILQSYLDRINKI